jgi:hypothetical protein
MLLRRHQPSHLLSLPPPLPLPQLPHLTATTTKTTTHTQSLPLPASLTATTGTARPASPSPPPHLPSPQPLRELPQLATLARRHLRAQLLPNSLVLDLRLARASRVSWLLFWALLVRCSCRCRVLEGRWSVMHYDGNCKKEELFKSSIATHISCE